jgi:hypothetical protein
MTGGGSSRVKDIPVDIFTARPEDGLGGGAPRGRPAREKVRGNYSVQMKGQAQLDNSGAIREKVRGSWRKGQGQP